MIWGVITVPLAVTVRTTSSSVASGWILLALVATGLVLTNQFKESALRRLGNSLAMALPFEPAEKQALLESMSLMSRAEALTALLRIDAADGGDDSASSIQ